MDTMKQFSPKLKALREKAGLNQTQLADKLGVSRGSISFYENGDRIPDIEFLRKVSEHFKVSADWLLGLTDHQTQDINVRNMCDFLGLTQETLETLHSTICLEYIHKYLNSLISERELKILNKNIMRSILACKSYNNQTHRNVLGPLMMEAIPDMEQEEYEMWKKNTLEKMDAEEKRFDRDLEAGKHIYISFEDAAALFADRASNLLSATLQVFIDDMAFDRHK